MNDLRLNSHPAAPKEAVNPGTPKATRSDEAPPGDNGTPSAFAQQLEADTASRNTRTVVPQSGVAQSGTAIAFAQQLDMDAANRNARTIVAQSGLPEPAASRPANGTLPVRLALGQNNAALVRKDALAPGTGPEGTGDPASLEQPPLSLEASAEQALGEPAALSQQADGNAVQERLSSDPLPVTPAVPAERGIGPQSAPNLGPALVAGGLIPSNAPQAAGETTLPRTNEPDPRKSVLRATAGHVSEDAPEPNLGPVLKNRPLPVDGVAPARGLGSHADQMKFEDDFRMMNGSVTRVSTEQFSESGPLTRQIALPIVQELESTGEVAGQVAGQFPHHPQRTVVRKLTLQLNPAELGVVKIDLRLQSGDLTVQISAEQATTVELLGRERKQLLDSLSGSGYQGCEVSINHMQVDTTPRTIAMPDSQWTGSASSGDHGFGKERQSSGKDSPGGAPQGASPNPEDGPGIDPLKDDVAVGRRVYV